MSAEATIELDDGGRVGVRPIRPDDKQLLVGAFERMSEDSRYRRFFGPVHAPREADLARLTEIDHTNHEALLAVDLDSGNAVGVVRYVRSEADPEAAEVAVVVVDDWQGRRLGRALLEHLVDRAREEGVRRFTALVQADNRRAIEVLSELGVTHREREGAYVELDIELPEEEERLGSELTAGLKAAAASAIRAVPLSERLLR